MIIGISGKMGCGKSTFAKHLKDILGEDWKIMSFATLLKEECSQRFSFPLDWCFSEEGKQRIVEVDGGFYGKSGDMTVRQILQWWGTDVRRAEDPGYWVRAMQSRIKGNVIIDDVRFPDELPICDIKVRLQPYLNYQFGVNSSHASETALDHLKPREWDWYGLPCFGYLEVEAANCVRFLAENFNPITVEESK